MLDRQSFIRSLLKDNDANDGVVAKQTVATSSSSRVNHGDRKGFIASLASGQDESSRATVSFRVVSFTLAKLRDFKGARLTSLSFKKEVELPRKRPNYDSSNRKMYSNPVVRVKQLDLKRIRINSLVCCIHWFFHNWCIIGRAFFE